MVAVFYGVVAVFYGCGCSFLWWCLQFFIVVFAVFYRGVCRVSGQQSPSPSSREQVIVHQEIPLAKVALSLSKRYFVGVAE